MPATFEVYQDSDGKYRWRLRNNNGQVTASAGQSFASKASAKRAATAVKTAASVAEVKSV